MGEFNTLDDIREELDVRLKENHKNHMALYKFKSLYSEVNVIYDTKLNRIQLDAPLETNLDRIIDIINKNHIYVPTKNEVNDPFEGEMIQTEYGEMGSWHHTAKKELSKYQISDLEKYRFLSLSSRANRPQMWGYYADTFKGLCLVFKVEKSFNSYEDVLYLDEKNRNKLCKVIEHPDEESRKLIAKYNLLLKADDWIKEDEVRIITDAEQKFINFDKEELIGIILGHNMEGKYRESIIEVAKENNVQLYKTYLNNLKLKVDILPYDYDVEKFAGSGYDYEKTLSEWRNKDCNKDKYSLGINGELL